MVATCEQPRDDQAQASHMIPHGIVGHCMAFVSYRGLTARDRDDQTLIIQPNYANDSRWCGGVKRGTPL